MSNVTGLGILSLMDLMGQYFLFSLPYQSIPCDLPV